MKMKNFLSSRKHGMYFIYVAVLLFSASCAKLMLPESIKSDPEPLEVHGEKVSYSLSAVLPPKAIRKGYTYTIKNFYVYGAQEKEIGSVSLKSEDYPNSKKEQSKKDADFSFDYAPEMEKGELQLHVSMTKVSNGKTKEGKERIKIGSGMITTYELLQPSYEATYAFHGYNDQEELIPNEVSFYFAQKSDRLSQVELRQERVKAFDSFISERNTTRSVNITGMHSPEGQETTNSQLAPARADAIEAWYRKRMKKYDYKDISASIQFQKNSIVEDWSACREVLREFKGVSEEEKASMLEVINGGGSFLDKEEALQKLSGYQLVFNKLYPSLRVAKATAMTVKEKRPISEIMAYSKEIGSGNMPADSLSHAELLYGAAETPLVDEKIAIYRAAIQQEGSLTAYNNLGAALLEKAAAETDQSLRNQLIEETTAQLEIAAKAGQAAEITINLAVVYLLQGNTEAAYTSLTEATSQNPSPETSERLNAIKGALEAQQGKYDDAFSTLNAAVSSTEVLYNKALVLLLQKKYAEADAAFQALKAMFEKEGEEAYKNDLTHARMHYGMAVSLARQETREGMLDHLQKAVSGDTSLKERAISDLEFRDYVDIVRQL